MRSRNGTEQDPQVVRELAAVDAALAGDPVDPELGELRELALLLQAERPRPQPDFMHQLDLLVIRGFRPADQASEVNTPAGRKPRLARLFAHRPGGLPLAIGTAASVFLIVTAVLTSGVLSGRNDAATEQRQARPPVLIPQTEPSNPRSTTPLSRGGAPSTAHIRPPYVQGPTVGVAPHARKRKVEQAASLTLAPPGNKIEDVADQVIRVTDRYQGFVLRSTVSGGDAGRAGGNLDLRIPSDRLQPAIRDLSVLAHVRSRTQNAGDVTGPFLSRRGRLTEALAERRVLLRQLARADTPNETASIRARLRLANQEIVAVRRSLHALQNRIRYAAVTVQLEPDYSGSGSSTLGDAFHDARGVLSTSLAVALVSFAVLIPVSILVLVSWVTARRLVRDRRERALDDTL